VPLKKLSTLKNLRLNLRREPWQLWVWLWGLGLIELAFRCEDIYPIEQWAATSREKCIRMLACCEEILNAKKRPVSHQTSVLDFFKWSWGPHVSPCCWTLETTIQITRFQFIWKCLLVTYSLRCLWT
jgi:hypothetical protein